MVRTTVCSRLMFICDTKAQLSPLDWKLYSSCGPLIFSVFYFFFWLAGSEQLLSVLVAQVQSVCSGCSMACSWTLPIKQTGPNSWAPFEKCCQRNPFISCVCGVFFSFLLSINLFHLKGFWLTSTTCDGRRHNNYTVKYTIILMND